MGKKDYYACFSCIETGSFFRRWIFDTIEGWLKDIPEIIKEENYKYIPDTLIMVKGYEVKDAFYCVKNNKDYFHNSVCEACEMKEIKKDKCTHKSPLFEYGINDEDYITVDVKTGKIIPNKFESANNYLKSILCQNYKKREMERIQREIKELQEELMEIKRR